VAHRLSAAHNGVDAQAASNSLAQLIGLALLAAFLAADGLTSTLQARMFGERPDVSVANQVLYVSVCSCCISLAGLTFRSFTATSQQQQQQPGIAAALAFCVDHPSAVTWIVALSASATASAMLITATVRHYGALVLSLTMTARQLASVLLSAATYGHPLTPREVAGMVLVFGALFARGGSKLKGESTVQCETRQDQESLPTSAAAKSHVSLSAHVQKTGE
jgi:drug/metabolite transporter (DMT)-like permease